MLACYNRGMKKVTKSRAATRRRKKKQMLQTVGVLSVTFIVIMALLAYLVPKVHDREDSKAQIAAAKLKEEENATKAAQPMSFTFAGVGDNLIHDVIFAYQDKDENGKWNFDNLYANTDSITQGADLAYINGETLMAGESLELSGYPMFNGPTELLDAIKTAGFDVISLATNHALDRGYEGIQAEHTYLENNMPEITATGTYATQQAAKAPIVREVNGIRVGMINFTYGTNGIPVPEEEPWCIDVYLKEDGSVDYDSMKAKLDELQEVSDVQIAFMHWGNEYQEDPTEDEKNITRFLNQQGVEVIVGAHPHVIQPAEIYKGQEQDTLVYYSLGNFISGQDAPERMVGGLARFTLTYDPKTKKTTFSDVSYAPTITYYDENYQNFKTNTLDTWTDEMTQTHWLTTQGEDISPEFVKTYFSQVAGNPEGIKVDLS